MLEQTEKTILSMMYVCQIEEKQELEEVIQNTMLSEEIINSKIDGLVKNQFVNQDRKTLTDKGRNSLRVVLAGGVFDIIHPGHIYTLNEAKKIGRCVSSSGCNR